MSRYCLISVSPYLRTTLPLYLLIPTSGDWVTFEDQESLTEGVLTSSDGILRVTHTPFSLLPYRLIPVTEGVLTSPEWRPDFTPLPPYPLIALTSRSP